MTMESRDDCVLCKTLTYGFTRINKLNIKYIYTDNVDPVGIMSLYRPCKMPPKSECT